MSEIREIVVRALDRAAGLLSDPELARLALSGQDLDLDRLELDSLSRFEAMMEIETALGIEIDDDEMSRLRRLDELVEFLQSRMR